MTDASRLKATVFVGGLTPRVRQSDLLNYFMPFGDIVEINLPKPENPNSHEVHRGFGYIEFESAEDAIEAIDNMDRSEIDGQVIKVAAAKPQKQQNEGLGSKTAVWEQVRVVEFLSPKVNSGFSNMCCRRAGWPKMLLPRRTARWQKASQLSEKTGLWILCKDSKVWTRPDQSRSDLLF